jgi:tRNA modification GTPase
MVSRSVDRGGARVVLYGFPNVGKSSLLNAITAQYAALVADQPGTTRDYVTRRMQLHGVMCDLIDTAGVTPSAVGDPLHTAAGQMTQQQTEQGHLQLFCLDATRPTNAWERTQLATTCPRPRLLVLTKTDQPRRTDLHQVAVETSSRTGFGLDTLARSIVQRLVETSNLESPVVSSTAARCHDSLRLAQQCLQRAHALANSRTGEEIVAAEVRAALDELGKVVGSVYTEDVLDQIFGRFCIGK